MDSRSRNRGTTLSLTWEQSGPIHILSLYSQSQYKEIRPGCDKQYRHQSRKQVGTSTERKHPAGSVRDSCEM